MAQLLDMVPTQVEAGDIPTAFSTGRIAGMITSPSTGVSSQAWDYTTHYIDTQAWLPKNMVFVNTRAFEALSDEEQAAILAAAETAEARGWDLSAAETADKIAGLEAGGMTVMQPSEALSGQAGRSGRGDGQRMAGNGGRCRGCDHDTLPRRISQYRQGHAPCPFSWGAAMLRRVLDRLYATALGAACLALIAIAVLVFVQIIGRIIDRALILSGADPLGAGHPIIVRLWRLPVRRRRHAGPALDLARGGACAGHIGAGAVRPARGGGFDGCGSGHCLGACGALPRGIPACRCGIRWHSTPCLSGW